MLHIHIFETHCAHHAESVLSIAGISKTFISTINVTWSKEMSHLSKILNSFFLHHFLVISKMFYFDANPITIGYLDYKVMKDLSMLKNNIKQEFEHCFCQYRQHPTHSSWSCHKYAFHFQHCWVKRWNFPLSLRRVSAAILFIQHGDKFGVNQHFPYS